MQQLRRGRCAWVCNHALVMTSLATVALAAPGAIAQSSAKTGKPSGNPSVFLYRTVTVKPSIAQTDPASSGYHAVPFRPLLGNQALDWATYNAIKQQIALRNTGRPVFSSEVDPALGVQRGEDFGDHVVE